MVLPRWLRPLRWLVGRFSGSTVFSAAVLSVIVFGATVRFIHLGDIYFWLDETQVVREELWADYPGELGGFLKGAQVNAARNYHVETTNGTDAVLVYLLTNTIGETTLWWARLPAVTSGILLLPVIFILTYAVVGRQVAGLFAMIALALSTVHVSQLALAYEIATLAGALVMVTAMLWYRAIADGADPHTSIVRGTGFVFAVAFAAAIHIAPVAVTTAGCVSLFAALVWHRWRRELNDQKVLSAALLLSPAVLLVLIGVTLFIVPKVGWHNAIQADYYYSWADRGGAVAGWLGVVGFSLSRLYDTIVYPLNITYDDQFYVPLASNLLYVIPCLLVVTGCVRCWKGSATSRFFLLMTGVAYGMAWLGSLFAMYPFGGVKQLLPLSPAIFALFGIGVSAVFERTRVTAVIGMAIWLGIWVYQAPGFYAKRLPPYDTASLLQYMHEHDVTRLVTVNPYGNPDDRVFRYHLRQTPEIEVGILADDLERSATEGRRFMLASTTQDLEMLEQLGTRDPGAAPALIQLLSDARAQLQTVTEIRVNQVFPPRAQVHSQSTYAPLNGLFLYLVEWKE